MCKGFCQIEDLKTERTSYDPYDSHCLCKSCAVGSYGWWFNRELLTDKGRCPCCNHKVRQKKHGRVWKV